MKIIFLSIGISFIIMSLFVRKIAERNWQAYHDFEVENKFPEEYRTPHSFVDTMVHWTIPILLISGAFIIFNNL